MIPEFDEIYEKNWWNGTDTRSGPGSSREATAAVAAGISELVRSLVPRVRRVLDAACGEGIWMPDLPGYVGVDAVESALGVARAAHPDRAYVRADIRTGMPVLPRADLVISRDTMQHLPLEDCLACLRTFRETGARLLLASTMRHGPNVDVAVGGAFPINLEAEPFSLGTPLAEIPDAWPGNDGKKVMALWRL